MFQMLEMDKPSVESYVLPLCSARDMDGSPPLGHIEVSIVSCNVFSQSRVLGQNL